MSKTFVIGDIHGAHIPLKQCLERSGFDKEIDTLITLGDITDGWPYVYECVEELLTIKKRIDIIGNHDAWFRSFLDTGIHPDWWQQGGQGTINSYIRFKIKDNALLNEEFFSKRSLNPVDIPDTHWQFFHQQILYYKPENGQLFIHAGFDRHQLLNDQKQYNPEVFYWDRELWGQALSASHGPKLKIKERVKEIFIGHTHCAKESLVSFAMNFKDPIYAPKKADIIINLDTCAGSYGRLTIMDVDTKEHWQSDLVTEIYGEYNPRG